MQSGLQHVTPSSTWWALNLHLTPLAGHGSADASASSQQPASAGAKPDAGRGLRPSMFWLLSMLCPSTLIMYYNMAFAQLAPVTVIWVAVTSE